MIDYSKFAADLMTEVTPSLELDIREFSESVDPLCESPIETMLGVAMFYVCRFFNRSSSIFVCASPEARKNLPKPGEGPIVSNVIYLVPQYEFQNYRIDWAVYCGRKWVFVECDGHDFHERTKEQAARDRKKDREIQAAGLNVLRFTGSEIYRDPSSCAIQVLLFLRSKTEQAA